MNVLKKFLTMFCMAIILLGVVGCVSDKSNKTNTKVKLFGADLNLTQEEFVAAAKLLKFTRSTLNF